MRLRNKTGKTTGISYYIYKFLLGASPIILFFIGWVRKGPAFVLQFERGEHADRLSDMMLLNDNRCNADQIGRLDHLVQRFTVVRQPPSDVTFNAIIVDDDPCTDIVPIHGGIENLRREQPRLVLDC